MTDTVIAVQQKKGFRALFLTEMWERFGFYTVAAILVLYMSKTLGFSDKQAYSMFAVFSALMYITPLVGGYIADNKIGFKLTLILGVIVLLLGYVFLVIPIEPTLLLGLSCIIVGNGFFKSMPYSLLGKLYESSPDKIDGRFTLYYLSINLGGIPAVLCAGYIAHLFGWNIAFALAAVGLLIALISFISLYKYFKGVGNAIDLQPVKFFNVIITVIVLLLMIIASYFLITHSTISNYVCIAAVLGLLVYLGYQVRHFNRGETKKVIAACILIILGAVFFVFYYQQPMSMMLFIDRNVAHHLLGIYIPSSTFWVFNPIWILCLGPVLSWVYVRLQQRDPSIPMKFAIGIIIMSLGYFVLTISTHYSNELGRVNAWWVVLSYAFQSLAELLISALGTAMIAKLVPQKIDGIMMGAWFLTQTGGSLIAGQLADIGAVPKSLTDPLMTLSIYQNTFRLFGFICLAAGIIALAMVPLLKYLLRSSQTSDA